jgi:rhamnosyltransferase
MSKKNIQKKIALGFVIYNSDDSFLNRIIESSNNNFIIYLFDNTPFKNDLKEKIKFLQNIKYFTCGKNAGLGFGISTVTSNAYYDGFEFLMFFDQDTLFTINTLDYVSNKLDFSSNYAAVLFNNENNLKNFDQIHDCDLIINSGSLFNLNILNLLGWHSVNYFVDGVDYEFCLRAISSGYKIGVHSHTPDYDHISGQEDKPYKIFGIEMRLRSYSYSRILDTITSLFKLIFQSFKYFKFRFVIKFSYFLVAYCASQILVRVFNFFELKD